MSVEHITGDLLDFPHDISVILHCANCQCTLGNLTATGIAKLIGDRYPAAAQADKEAHTAGEVRLGQFSVALVGDNRRVVNLYAQDRYGNDRRHLDYEALYSGLERIRDLLDSAAQEGRTYVLGLPYLIGCNRAGGDWLVAEAMIESVFRVSPTKVYIVRLPTT